MIPSFRGWVRKQYFYPDYILGVCINPTFLARRALADGVSRLSRLLNGRMLDIGCGSKPYRRLFDATEYVGMEYDSPENRAKGVADTFYDAGGVFPFPNEHFDSAIATEVLEHVFDPDEFLQETHRVLKRGGLFLLTCPFMWGEHQFPHDYGRYTSVGLAHLMEKSGFKIVEQKKTVTGPAALFQLLAAYIRTKITIQNYYVRIFLYIVLISPWTLLGALCSKASSEDSDIYIGSVILVQKL